MDRDSKWHVCVRVCVCGVCLPHQSAPLTKIQKHQLTRVTQTTARQTANHTHAHSHADICLAGAEHSYEF